MHAVPLALLDADGHEITSPPPKPPPGGKPAHNPKAKPKPKAKAQSKATASPNPAQQADRFIMSLGRDIARATRLSNEMLGVPWGEGMRASMMQHRGTLTGHQQTLTSLSADPNTTDSALVSALQACTVAAQGFQADALRAVRIMQPTAAKAKNKAKAPSQ